MHITGGSRRVPRALGVGFLLLALVLGLGALTPSSAEETPAPAASAEAPETADEPQQSERVTASAAPANTGGYPGKTPRVETNFAQPKKSISFGANSDYSQLNDLERLIRGSYRDPNTNAIRPWSVRSNNYVYLTVSRMEDSTRVGRELIKAAQNKVRVYVIHGKASQSKESKALQRRLDALPYGTFKICAKGRSLACLGSLRGAIMHSKVLMVRDTFDNEDNQAYGAVWSGSNNLGGPSGERTWNNGWTVYNDKKLFEQFRKFWDDMRTEQDVNNDYLGYIARRSTNYGISDAAAEAAGYRTNGDAKYGMFYSDLLNVTYYLTPIKASPTNGKDPVMNLLNRVMPDDKCRIRLQHNRFKYRRIAVAQKLVQLANAGCTVEAVSFRDDLAINRRLHCQQWVRICKPILDEFRTSNSRIEVAYAKPHDKTMLVEAKLRRNSRNDEERLPTGEYWPAGGARVKLVQAGSASLTGSNLVVSDEVTTESTDPEVYEDYLDHWRKIRTSYEYRLFPF